MHSPDNVALPSTVYQSTQQAYRSPELAVDGDLATWSSTTSSKRPWFAVDLLTELHILRVDIVNNNVHEAASKFLQK